MSEPLLATASFGKQVLTMADLAAPLLEQVSFDISMPEDPTALVNQPWFKAAYENYLQLVAAEPDFRKKERLKESILTLLSAVNNFDEISLPPEIRLLIVYGMQAACAAAFDLGSETVADDAMKQASAIATEKSDQAQKDRQTAQARAGGEKRGELAAKKADDAWRIWAKDRIFDLRTKDRSLTQNKLATALEEELKGRGEPRGFDSALKFVKDHREFLPKREKKLPKKG